MITRPAIVPISPVQYAKERTIVDRAEAYRARVATGRNFLTAEEAAHPDYAACDNGMRGRVEQYEILRDLPPVMVAYVGQDGDTVTTWPGNPLGTARMVRRWRGNMGQWVEAYRARIGGRDYQGRGGGSGMAIVLRETAASKRARGA